MILDQYVSRWGLNDIFGLFGDTRFIYSQGISRFTPNIGGEAAAVPPGIGNGSYLRTQAWLI